MVTGKIEGYGRDEITELLRSFGASVSSSVSSGTDMVLAGEDAGSKLDRARSLNIRVITGGAVKKLLSS